MASAAITIVESPATIESDTNSATITKSTLLPGLLGTLVNAGSVTVFLSFGVTGGTAPAVATTSAQAQLQLPLPAGCSCPILPHYTSIKHLTASGASVLGWIPAFRGRSD